jgi:hypothetical protein
MDSGQKVDTTSKVVSNSIIVFITSNLIVSILASSSLQFLWSFVNSLQLISYMPLMNIQMPNNLYYYLSLINGPMQFNLINTDGITSAIFGLDSDSGSNLTLNDQFSKFGFNSNLCILNLNNCFYYIMFFPVYLLLNNLVLIHPR